VCVLNIIQQKMSRIKKELNILDWHKLQHKNQYVQAHVALSHQHI